jgi:hypothetical protein
MTLSNPCSRVLRIASDTCKSVYNLWSPKKTLKGQPNDRVAMPKLDLDGTVKPHGNERLQTYSS